MRKLSFKGVLPLVVAALADPGGECFGGQLAAAAIEEDGDRRGSPLLAIEPVEEILLGSEGHGLGLHKGRCTLEIERTQNIEIVAAGDSRTDVGEDELHEEQHNAAWIHNARMCGLARFLDIRRWISCFSY